VQFKDLSGNSPLYWTWDFGNGQTSAVQNPSTTYSTPGTYTVTLIARNRSGANAIRKTDYITVYPYPTPQFSSNLSIACAPANVQFTDQSTAGQGGVTAWSWDFGDGTTSSQPSPSHTYSQTGYYNVSLKVTNSGGCSNTAARSRYVRVVDGIQPNFTWNQTSAACSAPFVLNFINQAAGPGNLTFSWNLGNGASPAASSDTSPVNITYPATGSYDVTLQVASSLGCSGSIKQTLTLSNSNAVITGPDMTCINTPVTFTDGSTPAPLSVAWDFGDGTSSTDLNPSKTYSANGTYTVKLTNTYGACTSTATKTVQVTNPPAPVFTADKTFNCSAPLAVQFTDQTTPAAAQWLWDFGDGSTSTAQNPAHTYTTLGQFTVKLTTTTAGGCSNTTSKPAYINVVAPSINLDPNSLHGCVSPAVISPVAQPNTVDGVSGWSWTVNGASPASSTASNPSFSFPAQGNYSGTVTMTTNGGCTATQNFNIQVGTPTPAAISATPNPVCGRNPVTLTSTAIPADQWVWDFGDGTPNSAGVSVQHAYADASDYIVKLALTNSGCTTSATAPIHVNPPIVGFTFKLANCSDRYTVSFTDTSHLANLSNPPVTTTYQWDFGDPASGANNTSSLVNPVHTYPTNPTSTPVSYTVTETVIETFTDGTICSQPFSFPIIVGPVVAALQNGDPNICRNKPFIMRSATTPLSLIDSYAWQVDGNPATPAFIAKDVSYWSNYPNTGDHIFTLTVKDIFGCKTSVSKTIHIVGPTAGITLPNPAGGCKNVAISFTDNSIPFPSGTAIQAWSWDFGDNTTASTGPAIIHSYNDTGAYTVKLTVTDNSAEQCSDTYATTTPIHITTPQANFAGPDSFYCPGVPLTFKDSSKGYGPFTYNWDYGDGSMPSPSPTHNYPKSGQTGKTYNVILTVTDIYNCPSTVTKSVRIQQPIAAFDISDTTAICAPLQTKFVAHGQYYDSLYWSFGDGTTSTLPNTSHFYNTTDTFYAKLFLRGPGGCLDSATRRVLVLDPKATSKFNYGPLSSCDSVPVQFNITPPGYTRFSLVFGDGAQDSSQNTAPFHLYRNPNSYTPTLVLQDVTGCIVNIGASIGPITVLGSVPFVSLNPHAFCDSSIVTFTDYTITNDGIISETLDFGDGSPKQTHNTGVADFNVDHFYNKPGTFLATLHVVTNNNCAENYTDTVRVHQTPHPVIAVTSPLCIGLIQFNGSLTAPQVDTISWAWDFGNGQTAKEQNPSASFKPGNYTVRLQTSVPFGCSDTTSKPITVNPLPEIKGPREINTPVGFPIPIPFTYSANVNTWVWTPTSHLDCSTCANPVATLIFKQQYQVTVTDINNCSSSDSILIVTICNDKNYFLPNTFSPNGDGVNDYFYPRGSNLYNIQSLRVFNRWGQMVFERKNFPANDATMGWDGNFNGRPAPVDAYVYIAEVVCNNAQVVALHGDVTLIR